MGEPVHKYGAGVGIIIPVRSLNESGLDISLASIRAQSYRPIELLVISGAGRREGNAAELPAGCVSSNPKDSITTIIVDAPATGIYEGMNAGILRSRCTFLMFLGAGDRLSCWDTLERLVEAAGERYDVVYGDVYDEDWGLCGGPFAKWRLCCQNIHHQGILYRRSVFEKVGLYDSRYSILADWEHNLRWFGRRDIPRRYLRGVVAVAKGGGVSKQRRDLAFERNRVRLIRRYLGAGWAMWALGYTFLVRPVWRRIKRSTLGKAIMRRVMQC